MQRRNYAALFAALVIGFGAIDAHAAEVRSVTITAPDSGATLGIGGEFRVTAVVRDFTPHDEDGVIIALFGPDTDDPADGPNLVIDGVAAGGGTRTIGEGAAANDVVIDAPAAGDFTGYGTVPTNFVGVHIVKGHGNIATGDSVAFYGGDAKSIVVDPNLEEVTYVWTGTVHVSSGDVSGIRAVAVPVEGSGEAAAATHTSEPANAMTSPASAGSVIFKIDAERPDPPDELLLVGKGVKGDLVTALFPDGDDTGTDPNWVEVAGIGNVLELDIKVGGDNMPLLLEKGHSVKLAISSLKQNDDASAQIFGKEEKVYDVSLEGRRYDTLTFRQAIAEGDFGDLIGDRAQENTLAAAPVNRNRATAFIVDQNGNRSVGFESANTPYTTDFAVGDTPPDHVGGAEANLTFLIDAKKPVIDGVSGKGGSDTLEVASPDTVTDGGRRSDFSHDENSIRYKLFELHSALDIDLGGTVLKIRNQELVRKWVLDDSDPPVYELSDPNTDADDNPATGTATAADSITVVNSANTALVNDEIVRVMFTNDGSKKKGDATVGGVVNSIQTLNLTGGEGSLVGHDTSGVGAIETGVKTVKVTGTDYAGNKGPTAERTDVYVDVADLEFLGLFPREADIKTIEETSTADVRFRLSEHADSVLITYEYVSGKDRRGSKIRALAGGELLDLEEQVIEHEEFINTARGDTGLVDDTKYQLTLLGADLAGNFGLTDAGEMTYDTNYVVPEINYFSVSSNPPGGTRTDDKGKLTGSGQVAAHKDPQFTVTVNAWNKENVAALAYGKVNYNNDAVVTVSGGSGDGLTLSGKGVVTEGMPVGVARLTSDAWGVGRVGDVVSWKADVKVNAQKAPETHTVKVEDLTSDADTSFVGKLDSSLVIKHAAYKEIEISVSDTVHLHSLVEVGLRYIDAFGNTVLDTDNYVEVSTSVIGVELPPGALQVKDGVATFSVRSNSHLGALPLTIRNVTGSATVATKTVEVTEQPDPGGDDAGDGEDAGTGSGTGRSRPVGRRGLQGCPRRGRSGWVRHAHLRPLRQPLHHRRLPHLA